MSRPNSDVGKIFTIVVAFLGIPINILLLAKIGEALKNATLSVFRPLERRAKNKNTLILMQLVSSILIGTLVFLLVPSVVIMKIESWTYMDSLYYTFVTLFTIGFGDYVAGSTLELGSGWLMFYRFALYTWIFLGMAYISLIIQICLGKVAN